MIYLKNFENRSDYNAFLDDDSQEKFHNTSLVSGETEYDKYLNMPLTFQIIGDTDYEEGDTYQVGLGFYGYGGAGAKTIQYRVNNGEWSSVTFGNGEITGLEPGDLVQFYSPDTGSYAPNNYANHFLCDTRFNVFGNINSLIGYESGAFEDSQFKSLFDGCYSLISAKNLILPETSLTNGCYQSMFYDCENLITSPELPATTLAEGCYYEMFSNCSSLTKAPKLPAITLAEGCYYEMFLGCSSLAKAPELPATTLVEMCYCYMFYGCSGLVKAPSLPATTLAASCYTNMFYNCTSLTAAPAISATTLAEYCCVGMFFGCSNLRTPPSVLPATTLETSCYYDMFHGCTNLITAPELPATTLAGGCYSSMFYNCVNLATAPALPATTLEDYCYQEMFWNCESLTVAPELPATTLAGGCYENMFNGCSSLRSITCFATDISATRCTYNWVQGVSATGLFTTTSETDWEIGRNGIPSGWGAYYPGKINCLKDSFTLTSGGGSTTIPVYAGTDWVASTNESWITFGPKSGKSGEESVLSINVDSSQTVRDGVITLSGASNLKKIKITQDSNYFIPLTFNVISGGTLSWKANNSSIAKTISYKINDGNWTNVKSTTSGARIGKSEPIPGVGTYVVSGLGTQYGFVLNGNGYYESNNQGKHDTAAVCRVKLSLSSAANVTFQYIYYAEEEYDYGYFGKVDTSLGTGTSTTSSNVYYECDDSRPSVQTLTYTVSAGEHYIDVKYTKDDSASEDNDSLQFKVLIEGYSDPILETGDVVQIRANNISYANESNFNYFIGNLQFSAAGNIMSLVSGASFSALTDNVSLSGYNANYMFKNLFKGCTALTSCEHLVLPAVSLCDGCYRLMFSGCTSLTAAPKLPATTLAQYCYAEMFVGCSSLAVAPKLPAEKLEVSSYANMFSGCSSLSSITCLATNISASNSCNNWVSDVASSGIFVKHPDMASWTTGVSGIPNNWTVQNNTQ